MTDQDRERERQKRKLRSRMLVTDTDEEAYTEEAEEQEDDDGYETRLFWHKAKKVLAVVIPVIVLAAGAFYIYNRFQTKQYQEYQAVWEKDVAENEFSSYVPYGTNVLRYSRDGASYIDKTGEVVWSEPYEMRSPMVAVSGYYVAIADREGHSIYICDENGCQGKVTTTLPVTNITVAGQGMVVALLEDEAVSYIDFFDKTGSRLDIEKKMWMGNEGYPIAMALSPSGTQLMLSCVYTDTGTMQNKIAFLNFSEVGELLDEKLAGGFDIGSTVAPQVAFLSDTRACAFLDNGVTFYSMKELSPKEPLLPEQGESYTFEAQIRSVFHDGSHVGIVTDGADQNEPFHLYVYNSAGSPVFDIGFDFDYTMVQFSAYGVCLYNNSECQLYNFSGQLKYSGGLGGTIGMIVNLSGSRLIRIGEQKVAEIVLK